MLEKENTAKNHFTKQEYQEAYKALDALIEDAKSSKKVIKPVWLNYAGISLFHLGDTLTAMEYLGQLYLTENADAQTYKILALGNRKVDNLSREIVSLEKYIELEDSAERAWPAKKRLFEIYMLSQNYELAYELWSDIGEIVNDEEKYVQLYFDLNKALDADTEKLYSLAKSLLDLNKENTKALNFLAFHYFWKAENLYQKEMKAYEENRTHRQYAKLLKAFDVLNADFKTSLNYFLKLYELEPKSRYAQFIGNIYLRWDDKSKARYYHSLAD